MILQDKKIRREKKLKGKKNVNIFCRKNLEVTIFIALVFIISLTSLTACGKEKSTNAEGMPIIKVAVIPFLNSLPIEHMIKNKLDKKYGFKIETVYFPSGGPMNEALGARLWEVGTLSAASVYSLANYNAHVIADVAHSEGGIETLVNPSSDILKIKGVNKDFPEVYGNSVTLKGKTIAVPTGTISHLNVIRWLKAIGVNPEDVHIVHMEFPQAFQALKAKKIDVAALNPPTSFAAEAEGMKATSSLASLKIPQYDSIVVSDEAYKNKKDVLKLYIKAFLEACDALQSDQNKAAEELLDWYTKNGSSSTLEACKEEVKTRPFVTTQEAKNIDIGDSVRITADFFASQELISKDKLPIIDKNVDNILLKEALNSK